MPKCTGMPLPKYVCLSIDDKVIYKWFGCTCESCNADIPSASTSSASASRSCCSKYNRPSDIGATIHSVHLDLPPVRIHSPMASSSSSSTIVPEFPVIPPVSTFKSIAGSGCTCGLRCGCPDCREHRGPVHASKDCAEECQHCVDYSAGIELPTEWQAISGDSIIDQFFTQAAALPNPPANRHPT